MTAAHAIVRRVHLVLALVAGLLLSVVTVSGAAVIFRTELDWLYADTATLSAVRGADADATAKALGERYPGARVQRLATPAYTGQGDEWSLRDEKGTKDLADDETWKVFTDPATGRRLGDTRGAAGSDFLAWLARFHHNLWLSATGGVLVGSAGLCLLGFIATGIWLRWPGLRRLGSLLRLRLRNPGFVRHYDLHTWAALLGIPLFIVLAITGAMFEFRWMRAAVHYGLGGGEADRPLALRVQPQRPAKPAEPAAAAPAAPAAGPTRVEVPTLGFVRAMAAAEAAVAGTSALSVMPPRPGRPDATWSVLLDYPGNVRSNSGVLVQLTLDGTPKLILDPRTMSPGGWVNGQLWGLHTGTWAGGWSKTLYLLVGLLPPALLVTGVGIWWHRRRAGLANRAAHAPQAVAVADEVAV